MPCPSGDANQLIVPMGPHRGSTHCFTSTACLLLVAPNQVLLLCIILHRARAAASGCLSLSVGSPDTWLVQPCRVTCASSAQLRPLAPLQDTNDKADEEFAIVFAAMGVNMETAHYFKQVSATASTS